MRVLGVDVGLKRTGLALSDETGTAIRLLPNLLANSRKVAILKLLSLVKDFSIEAIVIGRPDPKTDGSIAIASRADGLKKALDETFVEEGLNIEVCLWNEEFTSKKAMANLVGAQIPKEKRSKMLDGASAAVLVEEFLHWKKAKSDG